MDLSKFNLTPSAKKAIKQSQSIADTYGHLKVIDLHLLLSVLQFRHQNIDYLMDSNNLIKSGMIQSVEYALTHYKEPRRKKKIFAPEIIEILDFASSKAKKFKDEYVGIDHIFLSILTIREEIADFFISLELDLDKIKRDLKNLILHGIQEKVPTVGGSSQTQSNEASPEISDWCENLNNKILSKGEFEIFGRDEEIERTFEVLLKKNKSNIILVGDAGVGKTAIAEGIAEKIVKRQCPDLLLHKEVLSLNLTSILAGTIYRGQMEEKLKNILEYLSNEDKYILFIDEIHTIIGAGNNSEGGLDFANIIKPALSRGSISCIGATTKDEYNRFFKKDSALNRRFEKIDVKEPSKEETLKLIGLAKFSYEKFHQVEYTEEVLEKIVDLCDFYLQDKKFPDKAFDILDESGAKTKKQNIVRPQEAKDIEAQLSDPEFQQSEDFESYHKKYTKILEKWGENLKNAIFTVDMEMIYAIFASILNTDIDSVKNKNVRIHSKIGF
jgi:ATP-dependent Clp protease ATP-binding subunit ClpC